MKDLFSPQQQKELKQKLLIYDAAIRAMKMKLEVWNNEFKINSYHNPIHHIQSRIKTPESIQEKLERMDVPISVENMQKYILDLAGVRVVCRYIDDVYHIAELVKSSGLEIIKATDYIKNPKPNGYRSYHIVLRVPVQLAHSAPQVPVEVQIRTNAMDTWASLEHEILYKISDREREAKAAYLKECAEELAHIDYKMQSLFQLGRVYGSDEDAKAMVQSAVTLIS